MEFIQLKWENWSDICYFIKDCFIVGTYLDNKTKLPIENDKHTSNTIGLFLKINDNKVLVKQDDYIVKENNTIKIMTKIQFDRKRKLNIIENIKT